jgi:hypothetical protein
MGSWNETCAITDLPILEGEECFMLILQQQRSCASLYESRSYADTHFAPCYELIKGEYDSYGRIETSDGEHHLANIRKIHGIQISDDIQTFIDFQTALRRGEIKFRDLMSRPAENKGFALVFIKTCAVDFACDTYAELQQEVENRLSEMKLLKEGIEHIMAKDHYDALFGPSGSSRWALRQDYISSNVWKVAALCHLIEALRKQWQPTAGAGSDEGFDKIHEAFYKAVLGEIATELDVSELHRECVVLADNLRPMLKAFNEKLASFYDKMRWGDLGMNEDAYESLFSLVRTCEDHSLLEDSGIANIITALDAISG